MPSFDPATVLGARPPQPINPMADIAQILQLRQAQQLLPLKLQEAQQQQQENALKLQEYQRQIEQRKALNDAYTQAVTTDESGNPRFDRDKLNQALITAGHADQISVVGESLDKAEKSRADLREAQQKVDAANSEYGAGIGAATKATGYDPAFFRAKLAVGIGNKSLSEKTTAPILQEMAQADQQDPTGEATRKIVQKYADGLMAQSEKMVTAQARATTAATGAAKLPGELATQALTQTKLQQETQGTQPLSPYQQAQLDKTGAEKNPTETSLAMLVAKGKQPGATPQERAQSAEAELALKRLDQSKREAHPVINLTLPGAGGGGGPQTTGDEFLKSIPPSLAAQVKAIATGAAQLPSASSRSQAALQLRDMVFRYDPDYSDQRAQVRKAFTTGADGRNIGALNTAAVHLDQLAEASKAISQGSFRPGNAAFNAVVQAFGGAAPTNFEGIKAAVSGEMASALKGNATDEEIKSIKSTIDRSSSPEQLSGIVKEDLGILGAKLNTYQERYRQQIPNDAVYSPALPAARAAFAKHGVGLGNQVSANQPAAPAVGTVKGGYKFKGGNPADPKSWEKQ